VVEVLYCCIVVLFIVYCLGSLGWLEQKKSAYLFVHCECLHHSTKKSSRCKKREDFFFNCI